MKKRTTARKEADRIKSRVDAYYAGTLTYEEFTAQQIEHWSAIRARSERFNERVCRMVSGSL